MALSKHCLDPMRLCMWMVCKTTTETYLDGSGRAFLGSDAEDALVHVDGVLARDDFVDRALPLLLGFLGSRHLHS